MNLNQLKSLFADAGALKLYAKPLAENDNSKNQIYLGPDFQALNLFPNTGIFPDSSAAKPIFKAKLDFSWLMPNGQTATAPGAQFILYPQYPEVRFSGFLKGCAAPPSDLMTRRLQGRILFLATTAVRKVIGYVVPGDSDTAAGFRALGGQPQLGVFIELSLPSKPDEAAARERLLAELRRIHALGWIDSKQLAEDGSIRPCNAPQCGGFTLEAELGIPKNSLSEPDFLGWEVKQHAVANFNRFEAGTITLFTPEPTLGWYAEQGVEAFVRRFGYADKMGREDRLNFGGIHRADHRHSTTGLTLRLIGYNGQKNTIADTGGVLALISDRGEMAAGWPFSGLLTHWTRKHARAVYVPARCQKEPARQYAYGNKVRLAQGADFLRFLRAAAHGVVYYDPGIKVENASTHPQVKRRSQFRIASRNIGELYAAVEVVVL